jgi:hypothetical protein
MSIEQFLAILRRAVQLEDGAWGELRDNGTLTALCGGLLAVVVLLGGVGAWLWGETVLSSKPDGWFVDTIVLGSIFTLLLFLAGIGVTYIVLTQVYRETIPADALGRIVAVGYLPFALGLLVFIPEIGFGFGLLSVAAMFFYAVFGLRAAYPAVDTVRILVAVTLGFAVWGMILPLIGEAPDNNFGTGIFVFGLIA